MLVVIDLTSYPMYFRQVKVESNPKKAKEKLLELIDAKVLPSFLGGDYTGDWIMR